jgi:hypothetical protein
MVSICIVVLRSLLLYLLSVTCLTDLFYNYLFFIFNGLATSSPSLLPLCRFSLLISYLLQLWVLFPKSLFWSETNCAALRHCVICVPELSPSGRHCYCSCSWMKSFERTQLPHIWINMLGIRIFVAFLLWRCLHWLIILSKFSFSAYVCPLCLCIPLVMFQQFPLLNGSWSCKVV